MGRFIGAPLLLSQKSGFTPTQIQTVNNLLKHRYNELISKAEQKTVHITSNGVQNMHTSAYITNVSQSYAEGLVSIGFDIDYTMFPSGRTIIVEYDTMTIVSALVTGYFDTELEYSITSYIDIVVENNCITAEKKGEEKDNLHIAHVHILLYCDNTTEDIS